MNRNKFTIIIADDDADDQQMMKEGFEDCKVKVEINSVYNGLQLMDYLLKRESYKNIKESPDLILLDLNMPLMDGFNVLKEMLQANITTPVYVITTSQNKTDREKALRLGAKGFFSKGYSAEDIKKVMSQICRECFE